VLSGFVGFAVISKVPNTLHTPLMSGTNAIHGIVVLGALVVFGTLNVIGGFIVTDRMLGMFKGKKKPVPAQAKAETAEGPAAK
jgi:NAD(P) transhydrogenase subunit alpha